MKKTIKINGMSCGHCTAAVKNALEELEGVSQVVVSLEQKHAEIEAEEFVTEDMLRRVIEDAGYDVVD